MRKCYQELSMVCIPCETEEGFLTGSKVDEIKLEVEVDEYITIDEMTVTFE